MPRTEFSQRQREVIALRAQGLCHKEIGAKLGLTEGTVKVYMCRAAKRAGKETWELTAEFLKRERRDYMRLKALEINAWMRTHGERLNDQARADMEGIMAGMVIEAIGSVKT